MNLRTIIITLSLLSILITALGGYLLYVSLKKATLNEVHMKAEEQVLKVANRIDSIIVEHQKSVRAMAGHKEFSEALINMDSEAISKANSILDLFYQSIEVSVCYLMDIGGKTVATSNRNSPGSFEGKNYSFRPYFRDAIDGSASVYMALGVTSGKRGIYFGYPVYDNRKDYPVGVAVIKTSIDKINNEMKRKYDGILMVIDPHGVIFISSNEQVQYNLLWQTTEDIEREIADTRQFGKGPWPWSGIENKDDSFAIDTSGNKFNIHEAALHNYSGWKVLYLHDEKIAFQRMSAPIFRVAGYVIIVLLLIMVVSVYMLYSKASREIKSRKELEKKLRSISITDELTGLYNRRGFFKLARHQYHITERRKKPMRLYYLDIDNLKYINDSYGHKEGDNAISDAGVLLETVFRKSDVLARLGGDEFSALMTCSEDNKTEDIINRIQNSIDNYNQREERPFTLSISIGEVTYDPESPVDFDDFIHMADAIMYEKKRKRKAINTGSDISL